MTMLELFGLQMLNTSQVDAVNELLSASGKTTAQFVNAHCVNVAARDAGYRAALEDADSLLPDGSGMDMNPSLCCPSDRVENSTGFATPFGPWLLPLPLLLPLLPLLSLAKKGT